MKPPREQKIVGYKWVLKKKGRILGGEFARYKARDRGHQLQRSILFSCEARLYPRVTSQGCLVRSETRAT